MTREPVVFIGVIASIIVAIAVQLLSVGLVTSDQAVNLLHFVIVITPIIAAALSRLFVTPVAAPVLPMSTPVRTPEQDPADPPAAIVNGASPSMTRRG